MFILIAWSLKTGSVVWVSSRKVASSSLAGNSFNSPIPRKAEMSCCHRHSTKEKKWGAREGGSTIPLKHVNHGKLWVFFTRRHRLHVIMQNVSHHLRLFCAPTWPSYDVIGEHLLINKSAMLNTIQQARYYRHFRGPFLFFSRLHLCSNL